MLFGSDGQMRSVLVANVFLNLGINISYSHKNRSKHIDSSLDENRCTVRSVWAAEQWMKSNDRI